MTRPGPMLGVVAAILLAGGGLFWMTRRTPGVPPQEAAGMPFRVESTAPGSLLVLEPPTAPLRSLRWVGPLPGRSAISQILTQTGRQQAALFLDGRLAATATFEVPAEVSPGFFAFADLVEAAVIPDRMALLLYRGPGSHGTGLLLAWDLRSGSVAGSLKTQGGRLALAPDHRSAYLFGEGADLTLLRLPEGAGARIRSSRIELPPEVGTPSSLLPLGPQAFALAHSRGLSTWQGGTWTHTPPPPPSPLGFGPGGGALAGGSRGAWWQPEPGRLIPLRNDGTPGETQDLKALLPAEAVLDAEMLHLLGMDEDGSLWFDLRRPNLPGPNPDPNPGPGPGLAPEPASPPAAGGTPLPTPGGLSDALADASRAAWTAHLQKGLDRIYRWKPGTPAMKGAAWEVLWKQAPPPPGIAVPSAEGGLHPEAGGVLLGRPDRMWWLPLASVQPR